MRCIEIDFDVLETKDPKKLMVGDTSKDWFNAEDLDAYLYVTVPGSTKPKVFNFEKKTIKVFNSKLLNTHSDTNNYQYLPDGIYKIKLQSGFKEKYVEKIYLKTDLLKRNISESIVRNALNLSSSSDNFVDSIYEVDYLIRVAEAFAMECNIPMVERYYNEAVNKFKCLK